MKFSPSNIDRRNFLRISAVAGTSLWTPWVAAETKFASKIGEAPASHPLIPALKLANESLEAVAALKDYSCKLAKTEVVARKSVSSVMEIKIRQTPFSVYLKFLQPAAGREVIYVEGQNGNKLLVHETGFASLAGTLQLDPTGKLAMDGNRYPVTLIGMENLARTMIELWLTETKIEKLNVQFFPSAKIGTQSCQAIEVTHAQPAANIKNHVTRLYIDSTTKLPVRLQAYSFPARPKDKPGLVEDYYYSEIKTNLGLSDVDFDVKNPKYNF